MDTVRLSGPNQDAADPGSVPDLMPKYVNQICQWITACDRLHSDECVPEPILQRRPEDVPSWLVDMYQQCLVPGLSAHRYLALSYVWPETRSGSDTISPAPRTLLLDSANMMDFRGPGFLSNASIAQQIPMVIRHAMALTLALGERYLWVDRLCIVQNDLQEGGTLSQVAKMDKIYAGAYVTIIAAAPEEIYDKGLAGEWPSFATIRPRDRTKHKSRRRLNSLFGDSDQDSEGSTRETPPKLPNLNKAQITNAMSIKYNILSASRWATRGWTYQEQILCRRAVIFTKAGIFWDCHHSVWDGVDLHPDQNLTKLSLRSEKGRRFLTRWWPDFGFYVDLICPYNGRAFTYPQDALLGIAGVLNAMEKTFPAGFIHGLPRLFLDHALLWQPFGMAERRIDRVDNDTVHSSLPSWSWCGWQGFVDPWSLCSGLSYICEKEYRDRAGSWCTRNLVQWHLSTTDQASEPVLEPHMLDQYVENIEIVPGWTRRRTWSSASSIPLFQTGPIFTHVQDKHTYFKNPIPLKTDLSEKSVWTTPAYLTCSTTTASLFAATVLKVMASYSSTTLAPSKVSVFEDQTFKLGPAQGKACSVIVLQQPNGAFAGLLRLTSDFQVDITTPLELIAISTGSASVRDLCKSLEWRIFETGRDDYEAGNSAVEFEYGPDWISDRGKYALLFDIAMAFDKEAASNKPLGHEFDPVVANLQQRCDEKRREAAANNWVLEGPFSSLTIWFKARSEIHQRPALAKGNTSHGPKTQPSQNASSKKSLPKFRHPSNKDKFVCEFYNVLWVEVREGIRYRRACGWVPRYVWEAHSTGPVAIKLG